MSKHNLYVVCEGCPLNICIGGTYHSCAANPKNTTKETSLIVDENESTILMASRLHKCPIASITLRDGKTFKPVMAKGTNT